MSPPKAFVSYSWDNDNHKKWVAKLSTELRADGLDIKLDQWELIPGDQLPSFMETSIRENDYIFIICTPKYKIKSDERKGGVGYEGDIMTAEVLNKGNHRKFIPILSSGSWSESAPSWMTGKYYIDMSNDEKYTSGYNDIISTVYGTRPKAPHLGPTKVTTPAIIFKEADIEIEPIKILGVVVDEVTTPKMDGTPGSALYKIPFQLSKTPSYLWEEIFISTWNHPPTFTSIHRSRIASVIGDQIILNGTTIEEVEQYHKQTLLLCVDIANQKEKEIQDRERREEEAALKREKKHKSDIEDAASRIKF